MHNMMIESESIEWKEKKKNTDFCNAQRNDMVWCVFLCDNDTRDDSERKSADGWSQGLCFKMK